MEDSQEYFKWRCMRTGVRTFTGVPVCRACSANAKLSSLPFVPPFSPHPLGLQAPTSSLTARRSARPWATPTAAGCPASWRPTGARARTTAATSTCPAWTLSRTQRYYLKPPSKRLIGHSPPLAKRRLSVTNTSISTSTQTTSTTSTKAITSATSRAP